MTKPNILVALSTFGAYGPEPLELLQKKGWPYTLNLLGQRLAAKDILQLGRDCQGIVAGVEVYTGDILSELSQLKCISRCGVGLDNIDLPKAEQLGIKVLNTPDPVIVPVAELTIGMMLDLLRHITWHTVSLRDNKWQKKGGRNLQGCTVGIIGLGRIGKKVSELLKSFGSRVIATDPHPDTEWAKTHKIMILPLNELLSRSDVVTLHLKVDAKVPFVLSEKEIRGMKRGAVLLNLSRGELVDENALYGALKDGHLSGAGLDVFHEEPYRGKLTELGNVILTPHVATLTAESRLQMETQAVQNLFSGLEI